MSAGWLGCPCCSGCMGSLLPVLCAEDVVVVARHTLKPLACPQRDCALPDRQRLNRRGGVQARGGPQRRCCGHGQAPAWRDCRVLPWLRCGLVGWASSCPHSLRPSTSAARLHSASWALVRWVYTRRTLCGRVIVPRCRSAWSPLLTNPEPALHPLPPAPATVTKYCTHHCKQPLIVLH